jgi:hypothetical protein
MVTTRRSHAAARRFSAALALTLATTAAARADAAPPEPEEAEAAPTPRVHHMPIGEANAHEDLKISAMFEHGQLVKSAGVVYKAKNGDLRIVPLLRGTGPHFVAVIPADDVTAPGLGYAIEIEHVDGHRFPAFASRRDLQPVLVNEEHMDVRERALDKRLDGRRSVITTTGEFVRFGTTTGRSPIPCAAKQDSCPQGTLKTPAVDDQYWRVEVGYTYRPLRTVAEFGLRLGVVRGSSLVPLNAYDESAYKVGLNYASPSVRFRMGDSWHIDLSVLTSISEVGFSVGGGTALLIGDPYGTRLTLGAEAIGVSKTTYFGSRFYARMDLLVHPRVIIAPAIEVTDMPHAETFGVRLFSDVTANLGHGFSIGVRGGYQARRSTSGGVGLGGTASYAF